MGTENTMNDIKKMFLQAHEEYSDAIFRHCYFRVHDREAAKDLVQETFTRTWDHIAKGGTFENIRAFLFRTAANLIIDGYRKKTTDSLDAMMEAGFDVASNDSERIIRDVELREVMETFNLLEPNDRDVLVLRFVEGLEPREIAEILGQSANAVSVRIDRALKKIRSILNVSS